MEIKGLRCDKEDCLNKVFVDDRDSGYWATVAISVPMLSHNRVIHLCPECNESLNNGLKQLAIETSAVTAEHRFDPALARALEGDDDNGDTKNRAPARRRQR
jgi:hypothetical protein